MVDQKTPKDMLQKPCFPKRWSLRKKLFWRSNKRLNTDLKPSGTPKHHLDLPEKAAAKANVKRHHLPQIYEY